ncbi:hypothetical protein DRN58_04575 [Thermococci archaeon]|nr:MAG: hypothetical protein DRN58_04575 [Thermococci archaeon]
MSGLDKAKGIVFLIIGVSLAIVATYFILKELIENQAIVYIFMLGTAILFLYLGKNYWKKGKRKKNK